MTATIVSTVWSLRPLPPSPDGASLPLSAPAVGSEPGDVEVSAPPPLDARAFDTRIWNPREALALAVLDAERDEAAPPPHPSIDLIGIIDAGDVFRAALFEQAADRLRIANEGDVIEGHRIVAVTADHVEFTGGGSPWTLALER